MRTTMVILFALFAISAEAQQSIGSIDDVARIEGGRTIYVSTAAAAEIEGTFIRPKGTVLTMTVEGQPRDVPVSELRQISTRGDSLWNGAVVMSVPAMARRRPS